MSLKSETYYARAISILYIATIRKWNSELLVEMMTARLRRR